MRFTCSIPALVLGVLAACGGADDGSGDLGPDGSSGTIPDGGDDDPTDANSTSTLTWSAGGFLVLGAPEVWWTAAAVTHLEGTVANDHPVTVQVEIAGAIHPAIVVGTAWTLDVPPDTIPAAPTPVTVRAIDTSGTDVAITHTLAVDAEEPVVTVTADATTTVHDERNDTITFDAAHRPAHTHVVDAEDPVLGTNAGCPDVYKHVYFLDEDEPTTASQSAPNPIHWAFDVTDPDGVGIDAPHTAYRVRRADAQPGIYLIEWTTPEAAEVVDGQAYDFSLFRSAIASLGSYEGTLEVEMRGRDRFGREVVQTRCFVNHPLAPALQIGAAQPGASHTNPNPDLFGLAGLSLATAGSPVSAQITNAGAPGAAILEFDVWHGSGEPAYLTLEQGVPTGVTYSLAGQVSWAKEASSGTFGCGTLENPSGANECKAQSTLAAFADPSASNASLDGHAVYQVHVFDATAATWSELAPCAGCESTATRREFALPPAGAAAAHYRVILTIAGLGEEMTLLADGTGAPPYAETTLTYGGGSASVPITGALDATTVKRCAGAITQGSGSNPPLTCSSVGTYRKYRMFSSMAINFPATPFAVTPASAATASLGARMAGPVVQLGVADWNTAEPTVPAQIP